jgi:hypothetical protein
MRGEGIKIASRKDAKAYMYAKIQLKYLSLRTLPAVASAKARQAALRANKWQFFLKHKTATGTYHRIRQMGISGIE